MSLNDDKEFWTTLKWPAAPNYNDYVIYKQYAVGRILLLGSTKLLLPLCNEAWDLEPKYADPKIKHRDWFSLDSHWNTIILDGGLAFGKEFAEKLLSVVLPCCDIFISRAFLNPNWPTKYAIYFPKANELNARPIEHPINDIYTFYIWNNKQS